MDKREEAIRKLVAEGIDLKTATKMIDDSIKDGSFMSMAPNMSMDNLGAEVQGNPYSIYADPSTGQTEYGASFINNLPTYQGGHPNTYQTGNIPQTPMEEQRRITGSIDETPIPTELVDTPLPKEGQTNPWDDISEIPLLYGGGTSSEYEAYSLGNFLGMDSGTRGKGLGTVASAGALGLGLLRQGFSGFANQKQTQRSTNWAQDKINERKYSNQTQYGDRNYTGGFYKKGGMVKLKPKSKN